MAKKKSKGELGKMVDAQAKGKNIRAGGKDRKRSGSGELDQRQSKFDVKGGFI